MTPAQQSRYEERARVISAMAHPTRLFIMDELAGGDRCVCQLTEMIGHDMSTVSKHLSILRNAGLVTCRKEGTTVYYSLKVPCVMNFFSCIESVIRQSISCRMAAVTTDNQTYSEP